MAVVAHGRILLSKILDGTESVSEGGIVVPHMAKNAHMRGETRWGVVVAKGQHSDRAGNISPKQYIPDWFQNLQEGDVVEFISSAWHMSSHTKNDIISISDVSRVFGKDELPKTVRAALFPKNED